MRHPERAIQIAIVNYLRRNQILCFAVPNGGSRNPREGANLKKEGVLAGVSDLIVLFPNRCVFLEVKTKKGRQQPTQKQFEIDVRGLAFEYHIVRSIDDVAALFNLSL